MPVCAAECDASLCCDDIAATDRRDFQPIVRAEIRVAYLQVAPAGFVLRDFNRSGLATFQRECSDRPVTDLIKYFKLIGGKRRAAVS